MDLQGIFRVLANLKKIYNILCANIWKCKQADDWNKASEKPPQDFQAFVAKVAVHFGGLWVKKENNYFC